MGRHQTRDLTPSEPLLAKITYTDTGYPVELNVARQAFGPHVRPFTEPAWFIITATESSASRIRRYGHRAVGTLTTTEIPPQSAILRGEMPARVPHGYDSDSGDPVHWIDRDGTRTWDEPGPGAEPHVAVRLPADVARALIDCARVGAEGAPEEVIADFGFEGIDALELALRAATQQEANRVTLTRT